MHYGFTQNKQKVHRSKIEIVLSLCTRHTHSEQMFGQGKKGVITSFYGWTSELVLQKELSHRRCSLFFIHLKKEKHICLVEKKKVFHIMANLHFSSFNDEVFNLRLLFLCVHSIAVAFSIQKHTHKLTYNFQME